MKYYWRGIAFLVIIGLVYVGAIGLMVVIMDSVLDFLFDIPHSGF